MGTILTLIVVVLGIIALAQLVRVFELTTVLRGNNEYEVTDSENINMARYLMVFLIGFFAFFAYLTYRYGPYLLPEAASVHGESYDTLLNFNFLVITIVFIITHILLFYFALKYAGKKGRVAEYVTHNNTLELIWTGVPAAFLAVIVIYGISTWNKSMMSPPEDANIVELYAKQFDWTARYSGADQRLGEANYRLISATNPLGVISDESIEEKLAEMNDKLTKIKAQRSEEVAGSVNDELLEDKELKTEKHIKRILAFKNGGQDFNTSHDDKLVKVEMHLPVNKPVKFLIRSQDVIHSAFMPHFRAQMNAVPGAITQFYFTPNKTTAEMREITGDPEFNYLLLCNKICGSAHYNMKMDIVIDSEEEYNAWLAEQPSFKASDNLAQNNN